MLARPVQLGPLERVATQWSSGRTHALAPAPGVPHPSDPRGRRPPIQAFDEIESEVQRNPAQGQTGREAKPEVPELVAHPGSQHALERRAGPPGRVPTVIECRL